VVVFGSGLGGLVPGSEGLNAAAPAEDFGARLQACRRAAGLLQTEAAARCGRTVAMWNA
jgi:hypothetical protein